MPAAVRERRAMEVEAPRPRALTARVVDSVAVLRYVARWRTGSKEMEFTGELIAHCRVTSGSPEVLVTMEDVGAHPYHGTGVQILEKAAAVGYIVDGLRALALDLGGTLATVIRERLDTVYVELTSKNEVGMLLPLVRQKLARNDPIIYISALELHTAKDTYLTSHGLGPARAEESLILL